MNTSSGETDVYHVHEERKNIERKFSAWRSEYSKFIGIDKTSHVLDVGCGDGGFVLFLHSEGYSHAEGVDISRESVSLAHRLGIKNIHHGDGMSFLKGKSDHYAAVFLLDVLPELSREETHELLRDIHRALKSGGVCVIKTANAESPMAGRIQYAEFNKGLNFTEHNIKNILKSVGFSEQKVYPLRPVIHGALSFIRYLLWCFIEGFLKFYRLVETGSRKGVFTQSLIAVGKK